MRFTGVVIRAIATRHAYTLYALGPLLTLALIVIELAVKFFDRRVADLVTVPPTHG